MKEYIEKQFLDSQKIKAESFEKYKDQLIEAAEVIIQAFENGRKVFFCGNGGSAADSQHIAAEFIGRFMKERQSLPAIALTTDTSILTAIGNDYGYENVFSRQLEGLAQDGDVLIGISTSGNSPNVLKAVDQAKKMGLKTISLTGGSGGKLSKETDLSFVVTSSLTARIQEVHIFFSHLICDLVETHITQHQQ